jgi:hypothetical protein
VLVDCTATKTAYFCNAGVVLDGTLPTQLGWWANLTTFSISGHRIQGTIPSSIGAWTAISYFGVLGNRLSGTSTLVAWTALANAYFDGNNLSGTMPEFGGGFCPKQGNGKDLWADCGNGTGNAKTSCPCCHWCRQYLPLRIPTSADQT